MWRKSKAGDAPPRLGEWLARRSAAVQDADHLVGDLAEEYTEVRVPRLGRRRARAWYWKQVLRSLASRAGYLARGLVRRGGEASRGIEASSAARTGDSRMTQILSDVRFGLRTLLQTPTFTVLTVLTLGLAIGVNTAIFSMVNVLMLRPLPIKETESIAFIYYSNAERGIQEGRMSAGDFLDYRENLAAFTEMAAVLRGRPAVMTGVDEPERIIAFEATANLFDMWQTQLVLGRAFQDGEDRVGAEPVVVLSHGMWERRFGGDEGVLGRAIELDGFATTIVGVLDPEIEFGTLANADVWTPLVLQPGDADREAHNLWVSGRLRPGTTIDQAQAEVSSLAASLVERYPETNTGWVPEVVDINGALADDQTWTIFYMLLLTVAFVMAIACSNIATMMLSRAAGRSKEIAVRAALGAKRSRILSQLITESLLLSVAAGAVGLLATQLCLSGLIWMAGENSGTNFFSLLTIDRNVLLFTAVTALLAPLLFGFVPALRASRTDLNDALKEGARGSSGLAGLRGRRALVAVQVSLALALMVVAGLLIRTMVDQRTIDLGYEIENILSLRLDLADGKYPERHQWQPLFDEIMERVVALPDIEAAGWISDRPLAEFSGNQTFLIEGAEVRNAAQLPFTAVSVATQSALDVLALPVVRGRGIAPTDTETSIPVALVNEDMVHRYWTGADPLGDRIRLGGIDSSEPWLTVVGIFGDMFSGDPDNPSFPMIVVPLHQNARQGLGLVAKPRGDPLAAVASVRREVAAIDPDQPLGDVRTLTQIFADNLATSDTIISIFILFAVFALTMAATGIYGVMSFSVAQRTPEIGIRMALGAHAGEVMRMIGRQAAWLVGAGIVIGALAAAALSRVIAGAVPGLSPGDPWALGGVALVLGATAALAVWLPARRAVRIDPIIALKQE